MPTKIITIPKRHPRAEQTCKDGAERRQPERWRSAKQADCGPPKGRAT
nr:hypothetical protein [uncultured bacterium]